MALDIHEQKTPAHLHAVTAPSPAQRLHPAIYAIIAALVLLFAASILSFEVASSRNYLLVIAAAFALGALGLPFQLWRVRRHGHDPRDSSMSPRPLANWLDNDVEVWGSRMRGRDAATAILLPISAGAFGMLCFAIVFHIAVG